jgi:hypothetical protein
MEEIIETVKKNDGMTREEMESMMREEREER